VRCDESWLPAEDQVAYIASWSGAGAVCAYLIWVVAIWLRPNLRLDAGESMQIGAALSGAGALWWTLAELAFH
jgi:hypothetical protein